MTKLPGYILLDLLRAPEEMLNMDVADWNAVLQPARDSAVLGRLAMDAERLGIWEKLPPKVQNFFHLRPLCLRE